MVVSGGVLAVAPLMDGAPGMWGVEAREAAKYRTMHGTAP